MLGHPVGGSAGPRTHPGPEAERGGLSASSISLPSRSSISWHHLFLRHICAGLDRPARRSACVRPARRSAYGIASGAAEQPSDSPRTCETVGILRRMRIKRRRADALNSVPGPGRDWELGWPGFPPLPDGSSESAVESYLDRCSIAEVVVDAHSGLTITLLDADQTTMGVPLRTSCVSGLAMARGHEQHRLGVRHPLHE